MWKTWKPEIVRAIILLAVVAAAALLLNWARTPILFAAADRGMIKRADAGSLKGVWLIDSWKHNGWPEVDTGAPKSDGGVGQDGSNGGERTEPKVLSINAQQAKDLFDQGGCVFFDARMAEEYEEGHIPGALNWPYELFGPYYDKYIKELVKDECIVCYCIGGSCDESFHLSQSLAYEGFSEVYLYEGGIEEWRLYEYPVKTGSEP